MPPQEGTAMAEPAQPTMTLDEFLRWAEGRPGRYELVAGRVVAMAPERAAHVRCKYRIAEALTRSVARAGVDCEVFTDGLMVRIDHLTAYGPDALVHCGPRLSDDALEAPHPVIVVEVVSPSSGAVDRGRKLVDYFRLPSLRHYLVLDPDRRVVVHHERAGREIRTRILDDGVLRLDPPGIELDMAALFAAPAEPEPR